MPRRAKTDAVSNVEVDNIPNRPAEIYTALEARAKNPAVEKESAAARGWIGELFWNSLVLNPVVLVILRAILYSTAGGKTSPPLAPLFETVHQDKALQDASSLQSFMQNTSFSSADQIRASMQQARYFFYERRLLIRGVSMELGTTVVGHVQKWVFGTNCTSVLPFAVQRSIAKARVPWIVWTTLLQS